VSVPEAELIDAAGTRHTRADGNARIVSLVPRITELGSRTIKGLAYLRRFRDEMDRAPL
jgi:hypothetical protein